MCLTIQTSSFYNRNEHLEGIKNLPARLYSFLLLILSPRFDVGFARSECVAGDVERVEIPWKENRKRKKGEGTKIGNLCFSRPRIWAERFRRFVSV